MWELKNEVEPMCTKSKDGQDLLSETSKLKSKRRLKIMEGEKYVCM